jgi:hypothetical protein
MVAALVGACGTEQTSSQPAPQPVAATVDVSELTNGLLTVDQVWAVTRLPSPPQLTLVGTLEAIAHALMGQSAQPADKEGQSSASRPLGSGTSSSAELGQKQPLPGVTWNPPECAQMIEAAVIDYSKVQGYTRLFAKRVTDDPAAGGVRDGIAANAVLQTPAANVDFSRVRAKISRCRTATVTLDTYGGAVGTLTAQEISPPPVAGVDRIIAWRQTATWSGLPADAAGIAALFSAEATYMTKGDFIVWTSHGGSPGLTGVQLADPAFQNARTKLGF